MSEWLKDYGAAIGPSLAFIFAVLTLFVKEAIENAQRRRKAKHIYRVFKRLVLEHGPPQWIPVPADAGYAKGDANKGNHDRMNVYHRRLLTAKAFADANGR